MAAISPGKINEIYAFGPFRVDVAERLLLKNGEPVPLPGRAYDLLLDFVQNAGHLRPRTELIKTLWPNTIVEEANLNWNVNALRRALGDRRRNPTYVETVHGQGYRFIASVTVERLDEEPPGSATETSAKPESGDVGAVSVTIGPDRGEIAAEAAPTGAMGSAPGGIAAEAAPTGRLRTAWVLAAAAVIVVAGVLIWQFVPFGSGVRDKPKTPVIAVLPFENLSADANNAYFSEGIQDTILSKLAGIGGLRVISRASTKGYPSHPANLHKIAAELGASAIMEGSVQKAGDRVLINVQLVDAATEEHIWAHAYTQPLADIFAVENSVAAEVAKALKTELLPGEAAQITKAPTHNTQAYLLFLKANYYANQTLVRGSSKRSASTLSKAVALYHRAIALDPGFALAYARLSLLETFKYATTNHTNAEPNSKRAAKQALTLDPGLPEAHLAMAYVEYFLDGNLAAASDQLEQIPEDFRNNNAEVTGAMALIHFHQGKWREALSEYRRTIALDPRSPRWPFDTAIALTMLRNYPQATMRFNQAIALEPNDYYAAAFKAMMLLAAGKPLKQVAQLVSTIPPTSTQKGLVPALRFEIARLSRQPQGALDALKDAPDWVAAPNARGREPAALLRAQAWTALGNAKKARQVYEKARDLLQAALQDKPDNSIFRSFLGLAQAGLGQKSQAIDSGRKAVSLTPVSKDAIEGPTHLIILAKIYAQVGEPEQAIKLLRKLLAMPAGFFLSVPLLQRDPVWDPLRKNPEFQALLKEFANKPPIPVS